MNKFCRNSESNNSDYSKSKSSSEKNPKYYNLHFYGKEGFITFIQNYTNICSYRNIFFDEAFNLYKEVIFLPEQNKGKSSIECPLIINMKKNINNNIKNEKNKINTDNEKIIDAPKNNSYQLYIIIAIYLYYFLSKNKSENKNGNYTVYKSISEAINEKKQFKKAKENLMNIKK